MPELDEVKEIPKKTFVRKPNSNQDKIEKEEEELKELLAEQNNSNEKEEEQVEEVPKSAEEKTFKKRYGDLRRHTQKQTDDLQEKIKDLVDDLGWEYQGFTQGGRETYKELCLLLGWKFEWEEDER